MPGLNFYVLIIAAVYLFYHTASYLILISKWKRFEFINVKVIKSKLNNYNDIDGRRVFESEIMFEYRVNGKLYRSHTPAIKSPQMFPDLNFEYDLVDKYKEGENYQAKINPYNPKQAFLEVAPYTKLSTLELLGNLLLVLFLISSYFPELFSKI